MTLISQRLDLIKPSPTLAVSQKAAELKKQGIDVISMGAGEPDFDTPENIKLAAISAIKRGETKYTNVNGTLELRTAIVKKFKNENDLDYKPDEIIVSNGGKQVIYNLFMASLNPSDEVIIPAPYWVSYPDIVTLSGGVPIFVECQIEDGFKLTPDKLRKAISAKTKWLIINSPSNPSGSAYTKQELLSLASVLEEFPHVNVMTDDIYEHIIFDDFKFFTLASVAPQLKSRIFIVGGVSKTYSMTGWRIGYGAGNKDLVNAMSVIQSQTTSNASSISQAASIEALSGDQSFIIPNRNGFQEKRDLAFEILSSTRGLECYKPEGAFYLFPRCEGLIGKKTHSGEVIANDTDLASYLVNAGRVAVVPGSAFGLAGYFRISYAMNIDELKEGCLRIKEFCEKLHD
ncbi:MAG: pyridoxal phosphate-dependent aminotransferase [Rickettsiaceae bacterium]|nr:pyridoxal phosphate-dependent aminotransferase [Rickettsiaceae bacterium]